MALLHLQTLPAISVAAGTYTFGPLSLPDASAYLNPTFDVSLHTNPAIGWFLDSWISTDAGVTWIYAGGCGRAKGQPGTTAWLVAAHPEAVVGKTGRLIRVQLRIVGGALTLGGSLDVTDDPLPVKILPTHQSVAYDNSQGVNGNSVTTLTTASFTVGSGQNMAAAIGFFRYNAVTAITMSLGGVAATELASSHAINGGNGEEASFWSVIAPPSGSQTATASWTTAAFASLVPVTASGVDQTNPLNNGTVVNSGSSPISIVINSNNGDLTVSQVGTTGPSTTTTSNQTKRFSGYGSVDTGTGAAGPITHTWTGADVTVLAGANLQQAPTTLTGTIAPFVYEDDIVAGGKTIILTLGGDTWVASGATFDGQRQNIINGLTSAQSETHGWNNEVQAKIGVTDVVRTSSTVVTITLDAEAAYDIGSPETITVTIPGSALSGGSAVVATPTFAVYPTAHVAWLTA
jgi:hypothetical protein